MDNTHLPLSDVKDFLQTLGYKWNGEIVKNGELTTATNLKDFAEDRYLTSLQLHSKNLLIPELKDVIITPTSFTFYNQTIGSDIDALIEYEIDKDYTEQWVVYLAKKYGKSYQDYVKKLCKKMKNESFTRAKNELDKITDLKKGILNSLKQKLKHYQKLEELVSNVDEFQK